MQSTVQMTGQGGWPMSVFLTPDGVPFYAGTYFPSTPRSGVPAFRQILAALAEAWTNRRDDIGRTTTRVKQFYDEESNLLAQQGNTLDATVTDRAMQAAGGHFDWAHGGWGGAPKFPQPMQLEFLLAHHARTHDSATLRMVQLALASMVKGGIYDHLGGGFHRYATDAAWQVPHFEKMLYDNAQLARVYLHAWQVTGDPRFQRIVTETLDYVLREMTDSGGGFYSSQDADSESIEGKYYVWTFDEINRALGDQAGLFNDVYGVTQRGNFEGKNILHQARDPRLVAERNGLALERSELILADARRTLLAARGERVAPNRDSKVITAWNGLMLAAFAEAARVLRRDDYRQAANHNAMFLLREMRTLDGRLLRTWTPSHADDSHDTVAGNARLNGYLEDYSHFIEGLLTLYQCTFDSALFMAARDLAEVMLLHFSAPDGTFFDTSDDHEVLVTRPRDLQDNAIPAGNSMAVTVLLKLAALAGNARYAEKAEHALCSLQELLARYPAAFGQWLVALEFAVGDPYEVALIGNLESTDMQALLKAINSAYRPAMVLALRQAGEACQVPLLEGRELLHNRATAYVCRHFACQMPVNDADALLEQLKLI